MSAYFVFQNRVLDAEKMQAYIPKALATMEPFAPEILALDEDSQVIESDAPFPRTIIIKFASRQAAMSWYNSPQYQEVRGLRLDASEGFCFLVEGFCFLVDGFVWPGS